jgi:hypothetical protein
VERLYDPNLVEERAPLTLDDFVAALDRESPTFEKFGYYSYKMSPEQKNKWALNVLRDLEKYGYVFKLNIVDSIVSLFSSESRLNYQRIKHLIRSSAWFARLLAGFLKLYFHQISF